MSSATSQGDPVSVRKTTRTAPEVLAPAGDWEALRAAVANGADAVYFGLSQFSARYRATNFTVDELPEVMRFLHDRNVRGYVAINTLIFTDELADVAQLIGQIATAGVDAVIVQDLGLAGLIRRMAPGLPIHGSTQMTLTEPRGIEFVRALGIERVILARELSIENIRAIAEQTVMPLEVFVHGALCVAYSGQCLTSEALGGRSANRGQCAQACRLPYDLIVDGQHRDLGDVAYLLSPQDLAAYDLVPELLQAGVVSLKIEGRLKNASYVAVTTQTYRAAVQSAVAQESFALDPRQTLDLSQSFSRGFSPGFLGGLNHQQLVQGRFPKARGVRLGVVAGRTNAGLLLDLDESYLHGPLELVDLVKPGDGIVFDEGHPDQDEQGGRVYYVHPVRGAGITTDEPELTHRRVELVFGPGSVDINTVQLGALVWRTDDPTLRKRMERTYSRDLPVRRAAVHFHLQGDVGGALTLSARDDLGNTGQATWAGPLEIARKHPTTAEALREQLDRVGDTPLELGTVEINLPAEVMVPKSVLNELRRDAVGQLLLQRETTQRARLVDFTVLDQQRQEIAAKVPTAAASPQLLVLARNLEQLAAVLEWDGTHVASPTLRRPAMVYADFEDVRRYAEAVKMARGSRMPIGLAGLRIIKPGEEGWLHQIAKSGADAVLARNYATIAFFQEHSPATTIIGDFSLNIANELTADLFHRQGLARLVPSFDLSWEQLSAMLARIDPTLFEVVIHQHMPMFHMEHCVIAATLSTGKDWRDCGRPCDAHRLELRDRVGADFPLLADTGCRNTVFNSVAQSAAEYVPRMLAKGLRNFRVDLLREAAADVGPMLDRYARVLAGLDEGRGAWRGLQVLNQLGVTRGTLKE